MIRHTVDNFPMCSIYFFEITITHLDSGWPIPATTETWEFNTPGTIPRYNLTVNFKNPKTSGKLYVILC